MRSLAIALAALTLLACTPPSHSTATRVRPIERAIKNTVQLVANGRPYCAGVIVRHVILTAAHCAKHMPIHQVVFRDGHTEEAMVTAVWAEHDLGVLETAGGLPRGIRLAHGKLRYGQDITLIGHPLGQFPYHVTRGIISNPRLDESLKGEGLSFLLDAGAAPGNSGGPVLDKQGRLIGILSYNIMQPLVCQFGCPGAFAQTHIHGAAHLDSIRVLFTVIKPLL